MDGEFSPKRKRSLPEVKLPGVPKVNIEKYTRGPIELKAKKKASHKRLRRTIQETHDRTVEAATASAAAEILLPSDGGFIEVDDNEKTYKLKQRDIVRNVDLNSAKHVMNLQLSHFGPYSVNYSRNGRYMLFTGRRGHVAIMDNLRTTVGTELQLQQTIHDAKFLHNESLFATAQERYTYIYDHKGTEIHCLKRHENPRKLVYLPYHFLLVSVGQSGWIKWHDISTGSYVAGYGSGLGPTNVLKHNPTNAVVHAGHSNGVVTLWSPAAGTPLVSMFCHKGPVTDLAVDREGRYMATAGLDGLMKVWDLRKYTVLQSYRTDHHVVSLDFSERGLLAMGLGRMVQIMRDVALKPAGVTYLSHSLPAPNPALMGGTGPTARGKALLSSVSVNSVRFRPLEDVLAIGHSYGLSTILVPGSGEPNYDSFENNPFLTTKQRRESEIQNLINKLSYDMIGLDAAIMGTVDQDQGTLIQERRELARGANSKVVVKKEKNKARGRNKISAKLRRRQKNVIDIQMLKMKDKLAKEKESREKDKDVVEEKQGGALRRFFP